MHHAGQELDPSGLALVEGDLRVHEVDHVLADGRREDSGGGDSLDYVAGLVGGVDLDRGSGAHNYNNNWLPQRGWLSFFLFRIACFMRPTSLVPARLPTFSSMLATTFSHGFAVYACVSPLCPTSVCPFR